MSTYFVGGGFDCWSPSLAGVADTANGINVTGSGYADAALRDPETGLPTAVTSLWFHAYFGGQSYRTSNLVVTEFRDSAGTAWARLRMDSTYGGYYLEWYDGTTWHSTAGAQPEPAIVNFVDIQVKIASGVDGIIAWYVGGVLAAQLTGLDTSAMQPIASVRVYTRNDYYGNGQYSDAIIASYNTIGHTVRRRAITGNGPEQGWTGDYTSVNEATTNDSNAITADTTGELSTFTADALSATAAGAVIKSVAIGSRIRASGDVPTHVQAVLTVGGTDYEGPGLVGSGGYLPAVTCFDVNPATGLAWASIDPVNGNYGVNAAA